MRKQTLFLILFFIALAWSARAILPPDAEFREPELRARKIQFRKAYEKRIEARRAFMISEDARVRAAMKVPPWERDQAVKTKAEAVGAGELAGTGGSRVKNRFLISIVLLILIGSAVGYAKYATREVDR